MEACVMGVTINAGHTLYAADCSCDLHRNEHYMFMHSLVRTAWHSSKMHMNVSIDIFWKISSNHLCPA